MPRTTNTRPPVDRPPLRRADRGRPHVGRRIAAWLTALAAVLAACGWAGTGPAAASGVDGPGSVVAAAAWRRPAPPAPVPNDWPTYDRTGTRAGLSISTPPFTSSSRVLRGWTGHVDGDVYAQPLVVGREVVVATENDSVYAFNSLTGRQDWMRHLGPPVTGGLACSGDIDPSGITGTPVADVVANRLWLVTFSPYRHTLWSLNLTTGVPLSHRDVDGPGSDPKAEQQRGALALAGGRVFVPYGGLASDCGDYHGWVVGAPTTGQGELVSYVTPTEREAGIWSPPGPAVGYNSLYVATGNGTPINAEDNSDSVVRLSTTDLSVRGIFTPANYVALSAGDLDLGTTSPLLLPDDMVFQIGKEGVGYIVGAYNLDRVGGERAEQPICSGGFGGDAADGLTVVMSCFDGLFAVRITPATTSAKPRIQPLWSATGIAPGPPVIAGGVVWDATRGDQLVGFDLSDGRQVYATRIGAVVTSFPSLSVSFGRLFVPEGDEVVSYKGI